MLARLVRAVVIERIMKIAMKILVTEPIHQDGIDILKKTGEVIMGTGTDEDTIIKDGKDADAILVRVAKITEKIINSLPNLKAVAKHGIGVDNIDVDACTAKGVAVLNAPKSNTNAVAEHTVALVFATVKNIAFLDVKTKEGEFGQRSNYPTAELQGKTLGLIGMGNIATLVAKKLKAFDMDVVAYDPYKTESEYATMVKSPEEVYKVADVISIHSPLTKETKHMVSDAAFSQMKDGAFFVNASRGGVVDENALYNALTNGKLRGAGFDVFEAEPPSADNPLFKLVNVTVSPHNAALSDQALVNMATHAAQGICDKLEGRNPEWVVNK